MKTISIIVPLFNGKKYVNRIINMVNANVQYLICNGLDYTLEIIFINDSKEEIIIPQKNNGIYIKYVQNTVNLGIHKSRVKGLELSEGEWIVFLDQDDIISEHYFYEQLLNIDNYDASICNGKNWNRIIYGFNRMPDKLLDWNRLIENGNQIISPGMCIIRKSSIPKEWRENAIVHNGADDYFLWLLLAKNKCKYRFVDKCLYCHVISGNNASSNTEVMYDSVKEVEQKLINLGLYDYKKLGHLQGSEPFHLSLHSSETINERNRINAMVLNHWLDIIQSGKTLYEYFSNNNVKKINVYGAGILGRHLIRDLKNTDVEIMSVVDKYRSVKCEGIETVAIEDMSVDVDLIVITPVHVFESICNVLIREYGKNIEGKIISLVEVLGNVDIELE